MQDTSPQIHSLGLRLQPFGALADASSRDRCRSECHPASPVATMHLEPAHLLALDLVFPAIALRVFSPLAADHARLHLLREPKNLLLKIGNPVSLPRSHWSIAPVLGCCIATLPVRWPTKSKAIPERTIAPTAFTFK